MKETMSKSALERAHLASQWASRPISWAVRLSLWSGPFKSLRRVPLIVLCRLVELRFIIFHGQ